MLDPDRLALLVVKPDGVTQHLTRLISLWMRDEGHTLIAFHELAPPRSAGPAVRGFAGAGPGTLRGHSGAPRPPVSAAWSRTPTPGPATSRTPRCAT
ncbi:hypothetical protein [Streptomyces erythrochromogenes]|uniref:hypothetical protein n=1 Tax=Streptomyces erythrochromogenes TaxID=285574 RepID=UPI000AF57391|nr:hypothetical protein [Streptomyces erythrochromogenes]